MKSLGIGVLSLLFLATFLTPPVASAYRGDSNVSGPDCNPERHEAMMVAFGNNDYNSWKNLMSGKGRVTQVVTEQNFARFAEAHKLMQEGDIEGAKAIRSELGLGQNNGWGKNVNR